MKNSLEIAVCVVYLLATPYLFTKHGELSGLWSLLIVLFVFALFCFWFEKE